MERYRLQEWLNFITSELHKTMGNLFNPAMPEDAKPVFRQRAADKFRWVDAQLDAKQYLMGDSFSVADAYLFTMANWTTGIGVDISAMQNLGDFQARMAARPAVRAAMKAEGLLT